jgi:hypothetical protein
MSISFIVRVSTDYQPAQLQKAMSAAKVYLSNKYGAEHVAEFVCERRHDRVVWHTTRSVDRTIADGTFMLTMQYGCNNIREDCMWNMSAFESPIRSTPTYLCDRLPIQDGMFELHISLSGDWTSDDVHHGLHAAFCTSDPTATFKHAPTAKHWPMQEGVVLGSGTRYPESMRYTRDMTPLEGQAILWARQMWEADGTCDINAPEVQDALHRRNGDFIIVHPEGLGMLMASDSVDFSNINTHPLANLVSDEHAIHISSFIYSKTDLRVCNNHSDEKDEEEYTEEEEEEEEEEPEYETENTDADATAVTLYDMTGIALQLPRTRTIASIKKAAVRNLKLDGSTFNLYAEGNEMPLHGKDLVDSKCSALYMMPTITCRQILETLLHDDILRGCTITLDFNVALLLCENLRCVYRDASMKETLKANGFINLDLPKLKRPVYVRWTD